MEGLEHNWEFICSIAPGRDFYGPTRENAKKYDNLSGVILSVEGGCWKVYKHLDQVLLGYGKPPTCEQVWIALEVKRYEEMFEGTGL